MKKLFFLILFVSSYCFADSPLTNITFWQVYEEESIVEKASKSNHVITYELSEYLVQENPLYIKLAVINALGWDVNGQNNSQKFERYVLRKLKLKKIEDLYDKEYGNNSDILICYAYLKAMDNYFDVSESLTITSELHNLYKDDIDYDFVHTLVAAQNILNEEMEFCNVYKEAEHLIEAKPTTLMDKEVWDIYFEYFNLYKDYCD